MNNVLNQSYSSGFLSDLYYVNVEQNNYIDTGTEDFTTSLKLKKSGREIIHYSDYILVPVEDYWLTIRFDDRERSIQEAYKGKLVGIDSNVLAEIKNRAAKQNVRGFDPNKVLGKAIEPAKFNLLTRIDFWVGLFILIMSLIGILIVLRRYLSFYRSPVFTGLEMFGEVPILHQLIDFEVERELKIANKIIITKSCCCLNDS